jgi:hypothetical protein
MDENVKIEELHKRRNLLASFAKLIGGFHNQADDELIMMKFGKGPPTF